MVAEAVPEAGGDAGESGEVSAHFDGAVPEAGLEPLQHGRVGSDGGG